MDVLLFLNGVLLSRIVYMFNDERLPLRTLMIVGVFQVMLTLLVFSISWPSAVIAALLAIILLSTESWLPGDWLNECRFTGFLVILFVTIALQDRLLPAPWVEAGLTWLANDHFNTGDVSGKLRTGLWFLLGFLLVANEANLVVRSLFHRFGLAPKTEGKEIDQEEYNAGRIIGILERWLMYSVLFVSQNVNVIALIIAAKGFARFRQMDERPFAEYVLIGTLASTLLTMIVTQIILSLRSL
ncbi:MAG: hypothetical protein WBQ78_16705 [Gammaproteobacteria bacterium]